MVFGKKEHFTKEHYENHKGFAPAYLCELVVHCFELLSQVVSHRINMRFKGGNSMLLLLEEAQRFSIDVDVDTLESKETLIAVMEKVQKQCEIFTRLEIRQHKTKPWLPMISFNLFFRSFFRPEQDSFVMFDAVLKESPYPGEIRRIRIKDLYASDQEVEINPASVLISDKLLCLGPSTLGIPLGKGKEAQRLKHVFDIARLSQTRIDQEQMLGSLRKYLEQENQIQKKNCSLKEVIDDSTRFCEAPLAYPDIPPFDSLPAQGYIFEIVKGFQDFRQHLFGLTYTWDMLKQDMLTVKKIISSLPQ